MAALAFPAPARPALALPAGIGLRAEHAVEFLERQPDVGFIEVHAENYFGRGGRMLNLLEQARRDHALSLHGVGLSIGSTDPLDRMHLRRLACHYFDPGSERFVSSDDLIDHSLQHLKVQLSL